MSEEKKAIYDFLPSELNTIDLVSLRDGSPKESAFYFWRMNNKLMKNYLGSSDGINMDLRDCFVRSNSEEVKFVSSKVNKIDHDYLYKIHEDGTLDLYEESDNPLIREMGRCKKIFRGHYYQFINDYIDSDDNIIDWPIHKINFSEDNKVYRNTILYLSYSDLEKFIIRLTFIESKSGVNSKALEDIREIYHNIKMGRCYA